MKSTKKALAIALCAAFTALSGSAVSAASFGEDLTGGIHAGDTLVRLRSITVMPNVRATDTLATLNADVGNATVPELDLTYMIRDWLGVELILGMTRHQVSSDLGSLGGVNVLPPTLLLQYHFNHAGRIRPYVGAGMNYTLFWNNGLKVGGTGVGITNHSFGPALQAGVDYDITKKVFVNVDVKKIWMHTDATLGGQPIGRISINPLVVGVGAGMRF